MKTHLTIPSPTLTSQLIKALIVSAGVLGCSTSENEGWVEPPDEPEGFEYNGILVHCDDGTFVPTTGPQEGHIICVDKRSFHRAQGETCDPDKDTTPRMSVHTYLKALCANTFGGLPGDFQESFTPFELDDYPTLSHEDVRLCDASLSFNDFDELPEASDANLFVPGEHFNNCSFESYCDTRDAIAGVYPYWIAPDSFCNTASDGDPLLPGPYVCVGSADDACGYYYKDGSLDPTTICPHTKPGGKEFCVIATNATDAADFCAAECDLYHQNDLLYGYDAMEYPMSGYLDCDAFSNHTMVWADELSDCNNIYEPDPMGVPFSFSVDLLIDGGAHASSNASENIGSISFSTACVGAACDIVIDQLYLPYTFYTGTFYDRSNVPLRFAVDGVSVHLMEPVHGIVTPAVGGPPVVSFPSQDFVISVSTGDVSIDDVTLFSIPGFEIVVNQVVGTYSGGVLTLNVAYDTPDATMSLTLTTG